MKKMNRFTAISMAAMMAVASLSACGSSSTPTATTAAAAEMTAAAAETDATTAAAAEATDGKTYKIGVLQLVQHAALDKANEGFVKALDDSGITYEIDQQNASGEQSACQTISEKFVNDGDDLIYAIATPAAQAASAATTSRPATSCAMWAPAPAAHSSPSR